MEIKETWGYIVIETTEYINGLAFPRNIDGLALKSNEFHLSLIKLPAGIDDALTEEVRGTAIKNAELLLANPPKLTGEFLRAVDQAHDRETIIGLAAVENLHDWQQAINRILPDAAFSIPHITLYRRATESIGLNSAEAFRTMTSQLPEAIERQLKACVK